MMKLLCITAVTSFALSGAALAQSTQTADPSKPATARTLAECEKLSGAPRDTCMRDVQISEGKAKQPGTGGTAGSGSIGSGTSAQPSKTQPLTGGAASETYGK